MTLLPTETLLKRTTSRCPVCHADAPAEVWKVGGPFKSRVVLRRTCAEHGLAEAVISSDARFYWLAQGDPKNACCGGNACSAEDGAVRGTLGRNAAAEPTRRGGEALHLPRADRDRPFVQSRLPDLLRRFAAEHEGRCRAARRPAGAHPGRDRAQGRHRDSAALRRRADAASAVLRAARVAACEPRHRLRFAQHERRARGDRRRVSRSAREDVSLRQVSALPAIRRRAGERPARAPRRGFARDAAPRDRALRRAEHPDHARDDGDARRTSRTCGRRSSLGSRIRTCAASRFSRCSAPAARRATPPRRRLR